MDQELTVKLDAPIDSVSLCDEPLGQTDDGRLQNQLQAVERRLEAQQAQLQGLCEALGQAAGQFGEIQKRFFAQAEQQLIDLAVEIAGKILAREIDSGNYEIDSIVARTLADIKSSGVVEVYLNPDDLAACEAAGQAGPDGPLRFMADPSLGKACCVVSTGGESAESIVSDQIEEISKALKGAE